MLLFSVLFPHPSLHRYLRLFQAVLGLRRGFVGYMLQQMLCCNEVPMLLRSKPLGGVFGLAKDPNSKFQTLSESSWLPVFLAVRELLLAAAILLPE
jgi:hypothetical protein